MQQRLDHVSKLCQALHIRPNTSISKYLISHPPAPQYSVFYFQPQKRLAYCPIYKAASTSMLDWLLHLVNVDAKSTMKDSGRQISDIARDYYPSMDYPAAEKSLMEATRIVIVRHPFERVLSAYRDKLEDSQRGSEHGTMHYYRKYGRKIVSEHRKSNATRKEPTFEEFVEYLIHTDLSLYADDHWLPFYLFCTPCLVDYDFIVQFETFDEDFQLLLRRLDAGASAAGPSWRHVTHGGRTSNVAETYFSKLSKSSVLQLARKYHLDFQLFNYNVTDYLSMARDDP